VKQTTAYYSCYHIVQLCN